MDPLTLSVLAGGGAAAGSGLQNVLGNLFNFGAIREQNKIAKRQFREAMEWQKFQYNDQKAWQTEMANTAHQREVDDLRAAGLNPILSATGGSGANVPAPSVSNAPSSNAQVRAAVLGDILSSAVDVYSRIRSLDNETKLADSQVEKNLADAGVARANQPEQSALYHWQGKYYAASAENMAHMSNRTAELTPYMRDLLSEQTKRAHYSAQEMRERVKLTEFQRRKVPHEVDYLMRKSAREEAETEYIKGKAGREIWQLVNGSAGALSDMIGSFLPGAKAFKMLKNLK